MLNAVFYHKLQTLGSFALVTALTLTAPVIYARTLDDTQLGEISVLQLTPQGRTTYQLIFEGGPFPYDKDGSVFGNRERLLPAQKRGYYREYTVPTPRAKNRGAQRIVCGGIPPTKPKACYYTGDHYNSFQKITP